MRPIERLPSGTVTFLFTDIEGSTRLLRDLGETYPEVLSEHHRLLREAVEKSGGVAVGTEGDSLFAAFASATGAVTAAADAQRALAAHTWPGDAAVRVRMGLHTGEAQIRGETYVGLDVHRAARIAAAGHGGQTLVSESTRVLVQQVLPSGTELRDLGHHRLKDLAQPERIHQLVVVGLPSGFPALKTLDATPNNLPIQLTSFVGRHAELAEVIRLLRGTRLLTLTGPGGTGKTRLSLQAAAEVAADYRDGAFFVPLGPVDDAAMVAPAIVQALALREAGNQPPAERLVEHLRERTLLLVLDNFEQVLPAAPLVGELLRASAGLRILVTSRAALHAYGEQEFEVPPLGLPKPGEHPEPAALSQYEAVALFIQRAVAVKPDFEVTNANAPAVAEICSRLDGLPLAIELAAARVKLLPPQALLARLSGRLEVLNAGSRDLPARQQTLRGAIAWSHDLLDEPAQRLFARLSVFVGGCTLEAAEAVCGGDGRIDVFDGLAGLVDQSLVRQDEAEGEARFWMLFTIREFAQERLATIDDGSTQERHARYYLELAEQTEPGLTGTEQRSLLDRLDRENGNLRAALAWALEHGAAETGLRLGFALWRFWQMRGLLLEGADWLEKLIAMPAAADHPDLMAKALEGAGGLAYWRAEMDSAMAYYDAALELCRATGDRRAIANALYNSGFPKLVNKAAVARSRAAFEESLAIFRDLGDREMVARVLWGLGNAHYFAGEYPEARDALSEDVEMLRAIGDPFMLNWALHTLGLAYNRLGQTVAGSGPVWREAFEHFAAARDLSGITILLGDFSMLAAAEGDILRAVRLYAASDRLANAIGTHLGTLMATMEQTFPEVGAIEPAAVEAALAEGLRMTLDEAVAYALGRPAPVASGSPT